MGRILSAEKEEKGILGRVMENAMSGHVSVDHMLRKLQKVQYVQRVVLSDQGEAKAIIEDTCKRFHVKFGF